MMLCLRVGSLMQILFVMGYSIFKTLKPEGEKIVTQNVPVVLNLRPGHWNYR